MLLARYLGSDEFGQFSFAYAAALLFEALADLGIGQAIARDASGDPAALRRMVLAALPIKLLLALTGIGLALATALATGAAGDLLSAVLYFSLAQAMLALTALGRAVFQGAERMGHEAVSIALEGAVRLAMVAYAVLSGFGVLGIAKAYAVAAAIVLVATAIMAVRRFLWPVGGSLQVPWSSATALLGGALPFAAFWLLASLPLRADIVLLRPLVGDAVTGRFAAAVRLLEPTLIVPTIFATALLPLAARHHRTGLDTIPALLASTQKLLFLISGLVLALTWVLGADIVVAVLGADFAPAASLIQVLAVGMVALFAKLGLARMLFAIGRGVELVGSQLAAVALNLVLVFWLVPPLGAAGAAIAIVAAEALAVALMVAALREFLPTPSLGTLVRPLAVIGFAVAVWPLTGRIPALALGVLCAAAYGIGFVVARPLSPAELRYLRSSLLGLLPTRSNAAVKKSAIGEP